MIARTTALKCVTLAGVMLVLASLASDAGTHGQPAGTRDKEPAANPEKKPSHLASLKMSCAILDEIRR